MSDNDLNEMTKDEVLGELAEEADPIARRLAQLEGELERMRRSRARLLGRSVAACMVICALLFGVSAVAQQQEGLIAFQAGTPARADQINWNFNQLRQWIERKVGNVSDSVVTWNAPDVRFGNIPGRGDGGRALVHDGGDTLVLNYGSDFSGGTRVDGSLRVGGPLSVQGNSLESIIDGRIRELRRDYGVTVALWSTHVENGNRYYLAHSNFVAIIGTLPSDYEWRMVPGLANPGDPALVSFEAVTWPGFLRIDGDHRARIARHENSDAFRRSATFRRVPALDGDPSRVSLQSLADEQRYLRHANYQIFALPSDGDVARVTSSFTLRER